MAVAVIMPKQGQSVESCILTEFKKQKGEKVSAGDVLFAYETDKASFEEVAKTEGIVLDVFFNEGDEIPVLTNVMVIGAAGESTDEFKPGNASGEAKVEEVKTEVKQQASESVNIPVVYNLETSSVSPRARELAKKHGIDAGRLAGSGPDGRVIEQDVVAAISGSGKLTPLAKEMLKQSGANAPASGSGLAGSVRASDLGQNTPGAAVSGAESVVKPLTNMRKLIAKAMHASLQNSAQLTHHLSADARKMMEMRKKVKKSGCDVNITLNDMVCYAVIKALKQFPQVNAHFLGDSVRQFSNVHLGLAVDTDRGLMVPVVKDTDNLTIKQLATKLKEVAEACKKGSINPDLLSSEAASFTVSNLGNYGVEIFTPIVNLPQVAILGVNTIVPRPKDLGDGVYAFVPHMGLSLTYDHRAIDGGEATRFVKQIAIEIENIDFEI